MSGGTWGYQEYKIEEKAQEMTVLLKAVAKTEHIVDWAVCGDTFSDEAAKELFELWRDVFNNLYGS